MFKNLKTENDIPTLLQDILASGEQPHEAPSGRESAILIPLVERSGVWHVLYEVRAHDLKSQPGEICFPGGGIEADESPLQAARRETMEELLVDDAQIEILGKMNAVSGPGGARIQIFVGILHHYEDTWSTDEVDHTFLVPIQTLLSTKPLVHKIEMQIVPTDDFPFDLIPGGRDYPWSKRYESVYFYLIEDKVIWGFTGGVTYRFLKLLSSIKQ